MFWFDFGAIRSNFRIEYLFAAENESIFGGICFGVGFVGVRRNALSDILGTDHWITEGILADARESR